MLSSQSFILSTIHQIQKYDNIMFWIQSKQSYVYRLLEHILLFIITKKWSFYFELLYDATIIIYLFLVQSKDVLCINFVKKEIMFTLLYTIYLYHIKRGNCWVI